MTFKEDQILVLTPTFQDSAYISQCLRPAGLDTVICESLPDLTQKLAAVYGAVLVAEEALSNGDISQFVELLRTQPAWSDTPVIVLTFARPNEMGGAFAEKLSQVGNVSLVERPCSRSTLLSVVQVALRSRRRQYQVRELMAAQDEANRKRDEFFATLSHELRTPLNVILGWVKNCKSEQFDRERSDKVFEILERNAELQKGLIDDLLDISRIINGKMNFEMRPVNLSQLIESVVNSLAPRAAEKSLAVITDINGGPVFVLGDRMRLTQLLSNLIVNAIKFTPAGGRIWITLGCKDGDCELVVRDNGQGIDREFLPYVFDRLQQENMGTTREHGGLGLGLPIAEHIARAHNGSISVTSEGRGHGTTFSVRLSHVEGAKLPLESSNQIDLTPENLRGIKILVADDSQDILGLVEFWLAKVGVEHKLATSVSEAMTLIPKFRPDVIISDIGMPGEDGYSFVRKVRALSDAEGGQTPMAALTAYARPEERERALNAGFDLHITKPIDSSKLYAAIRALALRRNSAAVMECGL